MQFKTPRQLVDSKILALMAREIRNQKLFITPASPKKCDEIAALSRLVESQGLPKHLLCKKLPYKLGHGIFLAPDAKPIRRFEVIGPYAGEVMVVPEFAPDDSGYAFSLISNFHLTREEQAYFDPQNKYHPKRLYSMKLDALKKGNFIRFVNHSSNPNVTAWTYSTPKNNKQGLEPMPMEIVYIAKKTIYPGEQLLVSYEEEEGSYWGAIKVKPFPMDAKTFQLSRSHKVF